MWRESHWLGEVFVRPPPSGMGLDSSIAMSLEIRFADPDDAPALLDVIRAAFSSRPPVDPPADALRDGVDDIRAGIERGFGVLVERDGEPAGGLLGEVEGDLARLRRVSVRPDAHGGGVGRTLIHSTLQAVAEMGAARVEIVARREFPRNISWWERFGFRRLHETPTGWIMGRPLPLVFTVPDADAMRALGRRLAGVLRAGDLIVATGELGAGKTTLTQGLGEGLDVEGAIISPTFVLSRVHPNRGDGPDLVHVDAYRLSSAQELEDIDVQDTLARSVTVVEWGRGAAEWLAPERLEIDIHRAEDPADDERTVILSPIGPGLVDALEQLREDA